MIHIIQLILRITLIIAMIIAIMLGSPSLAVLFGIILLLT